MIGFSKGVRVWAHPHATDLRKGFNGLYALVKQGLKRDPLSGDLFLFVNRRRTSCKVLMWDGTGLCLFAKRLEDGLFAKLWRDEDDNRPVRLTATELQLFVEGCKLVGDRHWSPSRAAPKLLAHDRSA